MKSPQHMPPCLLRTGPVVWWRRWGLPPRTAPDSVTNLHTGGDSSDNVCFHTAWLPIRQNIGTTISVVVAEYFPLFFPFSSVLSSLCNILIFWIWGLSLYVNKGLKYFTMHNISIEYEFPFLKCGTKNIKLFHCIIIFWDVLALSLRLTWQLQFLDNWHMEKYTVFFVILKLKLYAKHTIRCEKTSFIHSLKTDWQNTLLFNKGLGNAQKYSMWRQQETNWPETCWVSDCLWVWSMCQPTKMSTVSCGRIWTDMRNWSCCESRCCSILSRVLTSQVKNPCFSAPFSKVS